MLENIIQNQGLTIALSGMLVVFMGLFAIAMVIKFFNRIFERQAAVIEEGAAEKHVRHKRPRGKPLDPEHLAVITVALEIYRKLYYDTLSSKVTFIRGDQKSGWKQGVRYDHRAYFPR